MDKFESIIENNVKIIYNYIGLIIIISIKFIYVYHFFLNLLFLLFLIILNDNKWMIELIIKKYFNNYINLNNCLLIFDFLNNLMKCKI